MTAASAVVVNTDHEWIPVEDVIVAPRVRREAVAQATGVGLTEQQCADIAIVATELATNLGRYAQEGRVLVRVRRSRNRVGVELVAIDKGPGIADIEASISDGNSSRGTLGIGLGAIRRLTSQFDMYSQVGRGTVIAVTMWGRPIEELEWVDGISRPISGDIECGDGYGAREIDGRRQVMLCDGLGHGPLAAIAARALEQAFQEAPTGGPKAVLEYLHASVRHTRGAVAGIAEFATGSPSLRYAGIGNVSATVQTSGGSRSMVSLPGIVGHQARSVREFEYAAPPGALVVLHSDGLTDRWSLDASPGLFAHTPGVVAATLLRDAARPHDDASVMVARLS